MKLALTFIFASVLLSIYGQPGQIQGPSMNQRSGVIAPNPVNQPVAPPSTATKFVPTDPVRVINGQPERADGNDWYWFEGTVIEVQPGGIRVSGLYTRVGGDEYKMAESLYEPHEFFVRNFPYSVAENDRLLSTEHYAAKASDVYSYTTVLGGSKTLHALDYGTIWTPPPPTPEQIQAIQEAAAKAAEKSKADRKAAQAKALKYNQDLADKGDAYGLMRLGERYRDGEGVPKDLAKARDYLSKAVTAGQPSAADELSRLDQSTNAPTSK
jgi:hypothetical protein